MGFEKQMLIITAVTECKNWSINQITRVSSIKARMHIASFMTKSVLISFPAKMVDFPLLIYWSKY